MNTNLVQGKTAFVTGAGSGIGRAVAELFAAEGARGLMLADIDTAALRQTGDALSGCDVQVRALDVADRDSVLAAVDAAVQRWGGLDCGINNAGVSGPRQRLDEYTPEQWRAVMSTNLDGVYHCMAAELSAMLRAGGGSIVNVSSGAAVHPTPGLAPYAASKAALIGLTRAAAGEYAAVGIRVNCVLPGPTRTSLWDSNLGPDPDTALRALSAAAPMGRVGTARELAEAIVWLCSDRASYVHGVDLLVDGGSHAFSSRSQAARPSQTGSLTGGLMGLADLSP
jgi:A-factor type gamma-butyrolactone 1'-reductase (1S-forming)